MIHFGKGFFSSHSDPIKQPIHEVLSNVKQWDLVC